MAKIVIVGGGWAGCAAAVRAAKAGMQVVLVEKTDMLLGLGNVGGIMRNNGRFTAAEENICLGAGELFEITDRLSVHRNVDFPGHDHGWFYDVVLVEPAVRRLLSDLGVELRFMCRAVDVQPECENGRKRIAGIEVVCSRKNSQYEREFIEGDVFIEATGSAGPMGNCMRYGRGCAMCILRCAAFGPRVSLTERGGEPDYSGERADGSLGALSGSCKLEKRSLGEELRRELEDRGFAVVPLPDKLINRDKLSQKVCQQYALPAFAENIILIDTGYAKLMTPFFELETLRTVRGFENVRFADPYAAGKGNSVRYMSVGRCDKTMLASGFSNLFLGGEKSGLFVGHTEAITTGSLAGYNAVCTARKLPMLMLSEEIAVGLLIAEQQRALNGENGLRSRFTFAGGDFFEKMQARGLYSVDRDEIRRRITGAGLANIYNRL